MLGEGGSGIGCSVSCANSQKNIGEGTDEKLLRSRRFLGPFLSNTWQNSPDHSPWTSGVSFSSLPSPPCLSQTITNKFQVNQSISSEKGKHGPGPRCGRSSVAK